MEPEKLYSLALAAGVSPELEPNCEQFVSKLMEVKELSPLLGLAPSRRAGR